jgi:hypothetical protein
MLTVARRFGGVGSAVTCTKRQSAPKPGGRPNRSEKSSALPSRRTTSASARQALAPCSHGSFRPRGLSLGSAGALRGRVLDWRGIGLNAFRIQARGPAGQVETSTTADGQYTMLNMAPGEYEVLLPDYASEPAKGIPILAGNATTVDWQEASRSQGEPTLAPGSPTAAPTRTATPVPANLIQRPVASPARPPPAQIEIVDIGTRAIEQLINWFLTGVAAVSLIAVVVIALTRRRR